MRRRQRQVEKQWFITLFFLLDHVNRLLEKQGRYLVQFYIGRDLTLPPKGTLDLVPTLPSTDACRNGSNPRCHLPTIAVV